jgi:hypothetical protein
MKAQISLKTLFSALIMSLITSTALAEDKIVFRPVSEETEFAQAVCRAKRSVSDSAISKQSQRFRGYLDPHQLRDVINHRRELRISQLVSAANALVFGGDTIAEVQRAEISVEIKSITGKPISEIIFRWSSEDPTAMNRLSDAEERLSFVDQGTASCRTEGPYFSSETCIFDAEAQAEVLLNKHLSRFIAERTEVAQKTLNQGVMIEVLYRTQSYADCAGRNAQAMVRTRASRPILRVIKRD